MDEKSKYTAQMKYLRKNYVRFAIDLKPEVLDEFKRICEENGTKPTTEMKKFIADYCSRGGKEKKGSIN